MIIPREYNPAELNREWLVSAGRPEEAALVVDPFADHPAPPLGAPWARCGFARGWEPGWGWNAFPAWLRVRHEAQGFDPTNPASVRKLEEECASANRRPLSPSMPRRRLPAVAPVGAKVEPDRRARQLVACEKARTLEAMRGRRVSGPEAEARRAAGSAARFVRAAGPGQGVDEKGMLRGRLVNGKVVLENLAPYDAKLINDHLEWSATHRMWARRTASSVCSLLTCST